MDVKQLYDLLERDYALNDRVAKGSLCHFAHILRMLSGMDATEITPSVIESYKVERLKEGAARQTVNNELSLLRRALNLAVELELLPRAPKVRLFSVQNTRTGFVQPGEFTRLVRALEAIDQSVADLTTMLYGLGWRRGEVVDLRWAEVDVGSGMVQLPARRTKGRKQRTIRVGEDIHALFRRRWVIRNGAAVFHRDGRPVRDFRRAWARAVDAIGHPGLLVHDLRRSFARNALLAGVPIKLIMEIAGWKTPSVFFRYAIMDEAALSAALDVVSRYVMEKGKLPP